MSESLSPNNLTPINSQSYEANLNVQAPLNVNYNGEKNVQNQIDKTQNLADTKTKSLDIDYIVQKNQVSEQQNVNIIKKNENDSNNSLENLEVIKNNIHVEQSKSDSILNQNQPINNSENNSTGEILQEQLQSQNEDSIPQEEQNLLLQKVSSNFNDQMHPINIPIEEIYGADRNARSELIFTVRFAGYNKIERITNLDMKKYHQPELIAFYEKCMTFCQPMEMPPYKPR